MNHIFIWLLACLLLIGCSHDEDEKGSESAIDRTTKKVADTAVEKIKTPLEKAEAIKVIEEQRTDKLEEQVQ